MNVFELYAKVSVNKSQAVNDIRAIETAGKKTSVSMGANFQKLGDNVGRWIKRGAVVAAGAITALGATSLKNFAKMDTGMREVFTLMPGLSEKAKKQMTADVKEISRAIGVLPNETIPALYQAISAGVPPDNVFEYMEIAGKAAKAGVTDLETSVDALTSVVNAYGAEVISATEASDIMFTAVRLGKTTFSELSRYLFQVTPVAAATGVSFNQIAAAMAEITAKGVPTRVAATQLRQMLVELSKAGGETAEIFEELSGQTFQDFMDAGNDLSDVLELMQEYADANSISLMDMFSSVEGGMAALNLGGQNIDSFRVKLGEMDETALATEMAFQEMADGIQFRLDQLAAWWQTVQINIGEELQEGLSEFLDWLEANQAKIESGLIAMFKGLLDAVQWLIDHKEGVKSALQTVAVGLGLIVAVKLGLFVASALNPFTAALIALYGVISTSIAIYKLFNKELAEIPEGYRIAGAYAEEMATRTEQAADAIERTALAMGATRIQAALLRKELALGLADKVEQTGIAAHLTTDSFTQMGNRFEDIRTKIIDLEEELGKDGLTGVFDQLMKDMENAWGLSMTAGDDWAVVMEEEVTRVLEAYAEAYPELSPLLDLIAKDMVQFQDITEQAMEETADTVGAALDDIEESGYDFAAGWGIVMDDIDKTTETAKDRIIDILVDWATSGELKLKDLLTSLANFALDMGKEWLKIVLKSQWAAQGVSAAASAASSALAGLGSIAAGVGGVAGALAAEGLFGGGIETERSTLGTVAAGVGTVAAGAAAGAIAGSVIPVIGTGIGALIGGGISLLDYLLPGMAAGGFVTKDTKVQLHGTPSDPEGVFRLNDETFGRIGEGIVNAIDRSGDSLGGTQINITIENPTIRDDSDIDKLVEGIENSFEQTRRGMGWVGAT